MAWRWPGAKPLFESMMVSLTTHIQSASMSFKQSHHASVDYDSSLWSLDWLGASQTFRDSVSFSYRVETRFHHQTIIQITTKNHWKLPQSAIWILNISWINPEKDFYKCEGEPFLSWFIYMQAVSLLPAGKNRRHGVCRPKLTILLIWISIHG